MKRKPHNTSPLSLFAFQDIITSVTGVFLLMTLLMAVELTSRQPMNQPAVSAEVVTQLTESIAEAETELTRLRENLSARVDHDLPISEFTQSSADAAVQALREELRLLNATIATLKAERALFEQQQSKANTISQKRAPDQNRLRELEEQRVALESEIAQLKKSHRVFYNTTDARGRRVFLVELFDDAILVAEAGRKLPPQRFSGKQQDGFSSRTATNAFLAWAQQQSKSQVRFVIIVHPGTTKRFDLLREGLRKQGFALGYDLLPRDKIAIDVQSGTQ